MLDLISKIFTPKESEAAISREEVSAMANVGEEEGVIEENENKIIQNINPLLYSMPITQRIGFIQNIIFLIS